MPYKRSQFSSSGRIGMASRYSQGRYAGRRSTSGASIPRRMKLKGKGGYWGKLIGSKIGGLFGTRAAQVLGNIGDKLGDVAGYVAPVFGPEAAAAMTGIDAAGRIAQRFSGDNTTSARFPFLSDVRDSIDRYNTSQRRLIDDQLRRPVRFQPDTDVDAYETSVSDITNRMGRLSINDDYDSHLDNITNRMAALSL